MSCRRWSWLPVSSPRMEMWRKLEETDREEGAGCGRLSSSLCMASAGVAGTSLGWSVGQSCGAGVPLSDSMGEPGSPSSWVCGRWERWVPSRVDGRWGGFGGPGRLQCTSDCELCIQPTCRRKFLLKKSYFDLVLTAVLSKNPAC